MDFLLQADRWLFRLINLHLSNGLLDWVAPFFSWNSFFVPLVLVAAVGLIWKGGRRGRVCLGLLVVAVTVADGVLCNWLKEWIDRPRPFMVIEEARLLVGKGRSGSMPSAHAANWFAGAAVIGFYYRQVRWWMVGMAAWIGFTRVYLGVHYPSDVLVGALVGLLSGWGVIGGLEGLWRWVGQKWYGNVWRRLPDLKRPELREVREGEAVAGVSSGEWVRVCYLVIGLLLLVRWGYVAGDTIQLSEDEAYQWMWSQHLDWSYYSKPPLIGYAQALGTGLWGDTEFGIRFLSPLLAAMVGVVLVRFVAWVRDGRSAFVLVLCLAATPLLAVGSTLMTIDALSVFFWTGGFVAGWYAIQLDSKRWWVVVGICLGFGFLSKYTALFQLLCWAIFFILYKPARCQLGKAGPWVAIGILVLSLVPVLVWNVQREWITITHLAERGGLDEEWRWRSRYLLEFVGAELGLLNPVFLVGMVVAAAGFWRLKGKDPLMVYCFCMGAPLFLFYLAYTLRARVQPNWIAPAIVPLFVLMVLYWRARWEQVKHWARPVVQFGVAFGIVVVVVLHDTDLIGRATGSYLPVEVDPLRRVRGYEQMAVLVEEKRQALEEATGQETFIIADHYGRTSLLSFYIPEAKAGVPEDRLVFYQGSDYPRNQYYFWAGYENLVGQNAIYVTEAKRRGGRLPERVRARFGSVEDLGVVEVIHKGRVYHQWRLFACRNLQAPEATPNR